MTLLWNVSLMLLEDFAACSETEVPGIFHLPRQPLTHDEHGPEVQQSSSLASNGDNCEAQFLLGLIFLDDVKAPSLQKKLTCSHTLAWLLLLFPHLTGFL